MRCLSCGTDNPADRRFCVRCGKALRFTCAYCGTMADPGARFCGNCGAQSNEPLTTKSARALEPHRYTPNHLVEKILTSRSAVEGERKHVTVLFADVKESMALAEGLDPEEWHQIMDRFFAILCDAIHRFEGTINQFTGDGIMALFGAPIAHEDHARRACSAALHIATELGRYAEELRREKGLDFSVRMGINSGEVVVGRIGDDLRMDYTAQGHTVGLAARMQELAAADTIYVAEHTARIVAGFFRLKDLGTFRLKGVRKPVRVYELRGIGPLRTRLELSRARGFSRFVGRDREMSILETALARVLEGGGIAVGVVAEAGTGKSRLCGEFIERCRAQGLGVHELRASGCGRPLPLIPVLDLLRSIFNVVDSDPPKAIREKITEALSRLDMHFDWSLPVLFDFLGVPDPERPAPRMDAKSRQRELVRAIQEVVRARGRREPAIFLCEDLHWIDAASESFLEAIVDALPGSRTLLLSNFRPEYSAAWMQRSHYQQLVLGPLSGEAIAEILHELLGTHSSLSGLAERIAARTRGNPFFTEELVRALVERGILQGTKGGYRLMQPVDGIVMPASVEVVLAARIDRLPETAKAVLQTAAVIGNEFAFAILRHVTGLPQADLDVALEALDEAGLLHVEALEPEPLYAFNHPLTLEAAYRAQLTEQRTRTHAAVARAIEEVDRNKLGERAALVAHHWEQARDHSLAASWYARAAEWVNHRNLPEALRHWRKVCELQRALASSAQDVEIAVEARKQMIVLGVRLGISRQEIATLLDELKQLRADRSEDLRQIAIFVAAPGVIALMGGELDDSLPALREALCLAERTTDTGLKLALRLGHVMWHFFAGYVHRALTLADDALQGIPEDLGLGAEVFGLSPYASIVELRAVSLREIGRLREAAAELDRAAHLARKQGELELLVMADLAYVHLGRITGDVEKAFLHARKAVETAESVGSSFARVHAYSALGQAHTLREEWSEAATAMERSLAIMRETRTGLLDEAFTLSALAQVYQSRDENERAEATAEEAVRVARRRRTRLAECVALLVLARVLLRGRGATPKETIAASLNQALALVRETGARLQEPFIRVELAELARHADDRDTRVRELRHAYRLFAEMGAPIRAREVETKLRQAPDVRPD